jgi:3-hydroxybutyryl-CoA dehydrogenase
MGAGIAHAFLAAGSAVVIVEPDDERAGAVRARLAAVVRESVERGTLGEPVDAVLARAAVGSSMTPFAACELVVEAVPEEPGLKRESLARIEAAVPASAVIASNTSSISITGLAGALARPGRFVGMHFFNPVPASALVEVVVGAATKPAVVESARAWVRGLDKVAVTVRDSPGFASSRLGVLLGLEAIRMLEEGVASADDIDAAMALGYRHPVGPLHLTDLVGLDVRLGIAEYLHAELGERFAPPRLLRDKVAAGELGRKSGRGFFDWAHT